MLKLFLTATITLLVTLATLTACSDPTPAPETLAPTSAPTPTAAPTPTELPVPTEPQAERPTAAPTATPASTPAPEPTPTTNGRITPLQMQDSGAMFSELSDAEKECIGENPERQTRFFGCLNDENIDRIFLAGFVPGPEPFSQETSDCVRAGFAVIDPRAVMTAGIEGDPGRAMAGSMAALFVTVACLTDQEWEETAPMLGMSLDEREGMQCLLAELGGPGPMAAAMTAAQEGDITGLSPSRDGVRAGHGTPAQAAARHSSTGAHTGDNRAHTGVDACDTRGQPDRDACDTHSVADQNGCAGHTNVDTNTDEHPVNAGPNTEEHPGDHRRRDSRGHPRLRPLRLETLGLTQTATARTPGRRSWSRRAW